MDDPTDSRTVPRFSNGVIMLPGKKISQLTQAAIAALTDEVAVSKVGAEDTVALTLAQLATLMETVLTSVFVNITGDSMTGALTIDKGSTGVQLTLEGAYDDVELRIDSTKAAGGSGDLRILGSNDREPEIKFGVSGADEDLGRIQYGNPGWAWGEAVRIFVQNKCHLTITPEGHTAIKFNDNKFLPDAMLHVEPDDRFTVIQNIKRVADQNANMAQWTDENDNIFMRVHHSGWLNIGKTTAPADNNVSNNELVMWWDQANDQVAWKAKTNAGVIKTGTLALA